MKYKTENLTVLYIEDNTEVRKMVTSLLEKTFKQTIVASNGLDGLNLFVTYYAQIDVIITDLRMPKLNGIEMIGQIRKLNSSIPIFITTAFLDDTKYSYELGQANIKKFYEKPINMIEILDDIGKYASVN